MNCMLACVELHVEQKAEPSCQCTARLLSETFMLSLICPKAAIKIRTCLRYYIYSQDIATIIDLNNHIHFF